MKKIVFSAVLAGALAAAAGDRAPGMHYDRYFNHYTDSFVTKIFLKSKTKETPTTTMEQVRTLIRNFHAFSGGMHQIIYLVGWQYAGHDSKFPSWDKVGDQCKSSLSDDPLTSLRMVMREAREKYNCDLSLHLNMNDAHPDSPDWKLYNDQDLLCKDKNGKIRPLGTWYRISHVKEWKSGYAKKRIDALLAMIPELKDAKTVHIDAFFAQSSDFDNISIEDDKAAIKAITDYWHSLGIDVTNEFITSLDMIGYFPMVYHYNLDERQRLLYPAEVVSPGDNLWNGRLFCDYYHTYKPNYGPLMTTPAGGCCYDEAWGIGNFCDMSGGTAVNPKGFLDQIFRTAILFAWYNRHPPVRHSVTATDYAVERKDGVVSNVRMQNRHLTVRQNGRLVVDGRDCLLDMPYGGGTLLAFSQKGCDREFDLPPEYAAATALEGKSWPEGTPCRLAVSNGKVRIKLPACRSMTLHAK